MTECRWSKKSSHPVGGRPIIFSADQTLLRLSKDSVGFFGFGIRFFQDLGVKLWFFQDLVFGFLRFRIQGFNLFLVSKDLFRALQQCKDATDSRLPITYSVKGEKASIFGLKWLFYRIQDQGFRLQTPSFGRQALSVRRLALRLTLQAHSHVFAPDFILSRVS